MVRHLLSELRVFGLQALAVTAPRSVELDKHVFAVVVDDGVKVLRHQSLENAHRATNLASGNF